MVTLDEAKKEYAWLGEVIGLESVGDYQIAIYREKELNSRNVFTGKILYAPYHNGKKLSVSCGSLESALITAIVWVNEGPNAHFDEFICKAMGIEQ